jgi:two-component system cell cycle response regulator DivK
MAKRILYVEDNEYNRKIVRQLLKNQPYELEFAADGESGVRMAIETRPDLILMDVQLPKLSGLEATRMLRADERTRDIPVLVITSFALSGDCQRATEAGAVGYLAKPYSPRELLTLVQRFLPEEGP